jgi:hypothetical protein
MRDHSTNGSKVSNLPVAIRYALILAQPYLTQWLNPPTNPFHHRPGINPK